MHLGTRDAGIVAEEIARRGIADAVVLTDGETWARQVRDEADGAVAGAQLRIDAERLLLEELAVAGTRYATRAEIARTMELVRLGKVEPIVGARYPLESLEHALRRARDADVFGRIMIDIAEE